MITAAQIAMELGCSRPPSQGEYVVKCPNTSAHKHGDKSMSCSVSDGDKGPIWNCFVCDKDALTRAMHDKFPELKKGQEKGDTRQWSVWGDGIARAFAAEWDYRDIDEAGKTFTAYKCRRFDKKEGGKDFYPIINDGGSWRIKKKSDPLNRILYNRLQVLSYAQAGRIIFFVEGEKCADALIGRGYCATAILGGSKSHWEPQYSADLKGASVIILPDNDKVGKDFAHRVAGELTNASIKCMVVELPDLKRAKDDVFDWFLYGHTTAELETLVRPKVEAGQWWTPAQAVIEQKPESNIVRIYQDEPIGQFVDTEMSNRERFLKEHVGNIYWTSEHKWLTWDGKRYRPDTTDGARVQELTIETLRKVKNEIGTASGEVREALAKWSKKCESRQVIRHTQELVRTAVSIESPKDVFDIDPYLLNCQNGIVDLRSGKIAVHDRDSMLTKITQCDYDPKAKAPRWTEFLKRCFDGDGEMILFLQQWLGYCATGKVHHQYFAFYYGPEGTGKSTAIEVPRYILGDYAKAVSKKIIMQQRNETKKSNPSQLMGIRYATIDEVGDRDKVDPEILKAITGDEAIPADKLYHDAFQFEPISKLVIRGNEKPEVRDRGGVWRRMLLVPFVMKIVKDRMNDSGDYKETLLAEGAGILAWIIAGSMEVYSENKIWIPKRVIDETKQYQDESDIFRNFIEEAIDSESYLNIGATDLYEGYRRWCQINGHGVFSNTKFGKELISRNYERYESEGKRKYRGIGLKPEYQTKGSKQQHIDYQND